MVTVCSRERACIGSKCKGCPGRAPRARSVDSKNPTVLFVVGTMGFLIILVSILLLDVSFAEFIFGPAEKITRSRKLQDADGADGQALGEKLGLVRHCVLFLTHTSGHSYDCARCLVAWL